MNTYGSPKRNGRYFQVPLCAFAFGASHQERHEAIIAFGVIQAGEKRWKALDEREQQELLTSIRRAGKIPADFKETTPSHIHAVVGADVTGVKLVSVSKLLKNYHKLQAFKSSFEQRHGPDAMVRLKTAFVIEASGGKGIKPEELAVLAAIYSVVGDKPHPVRITKKCIYYRALGYKSRAVFDAESSARNDGAKPLSDWQVRSILDRLHVRKLFARATYGNRETYYSHRMKETLLRQKISDKKTNPHATGLLARLDDKAMTDHIRNTRAAMGGHPPPKPQANPFVIPAKCDPDEVL